MFTFLIFLVKVLSTKYFKMFCSLLKTQVFKNNINHCCVVLSSTEERLNDRLPLAKWKPDTDNLMDQCWQRKHSGVQQPGTMKLLYTFKPALPLYFWLIKHVQQELSRCLHYLFYESNFRPFRTFLCWLIIQVGPKIKTYLFTPELVRRT